MFQNLGSELILGKAIRAQSETPKDRKDVLCFVNSRDS